MKRVADDNDILTVPALCDTLAVLVMQVAMVEGLIEAENAKPEGWPNGHIAQHRQAMYATMTWTTQSYPGFLEIVRKVLGSHPFQQPADIRFDNLVTSDFYSRFKLEDRNTPLNVAS